MAASSEPVGHEAAVVVNGHSTENGVKNGKATDGHVTEKSAESATPGSISTAKNIYKSAKDKDGNWTWVDKYPEDVAEAAENDETAKFAVVVRNKKSQDSRKKLEADSIVIQSPWLKKALGEILEDYPGVSCELQRLVFEAPFQPFVHRWASLLKFMNKKLDSTTREHMELLADILRQELKEEIKAFEDYVAHGVITFEHMWMIFQPGGIILSAHRGPLSAFELSEAEYMENRCGKFLRLKCEVVDWNGKQFGRGSHNIDIFSFNGTKKITNLHAYPFIFHEDREGTKASLIKRGKTFEKLAGYHFKSYSGAAITWDREGNEVPIQVRETSDPN
jgi:hypothetical protein